MKKVEITISEELEQEISEIVKLKSRGDYVAKEKDVILKVLELYTSRYKNMVKGSVNTVKRVVGKQ